MRKDEPVLEVRVAIERRIELPIEVGLLVVQIHGHHELNRALAFLGDVAIRMFEGAAQGQALQKPAARVLADLLNGLVDLHGLAVLAFVGATHFHDPLDQGLVGEQVSDSFLMLRSAFRERREFSWRRMTQQCALRELGVQSLTVQELPDVRQDGLRCEQSLPLGFPRRPGWRWRIAAGRPSVWSGSVVREPARRLREPR